MDAALPVGSGRPLPPSSLSRPPPFGSPEWEALPTDDPRRMQAVWHAAHCWRRWWQPDMVALRALQADEDACYRLRAVSTDLSSAGGWARLSRRASHAELVQRRGGPYFCIRCQRAYYLLPGTVAGADDDCGCAARDTTAPAAPDAA